MTRLPCNRQPSWTDSLYQNLWYGERASSFPQLPPLSSLFFTLDSSGSFAVHSLICAAVTGEELSVSMTWIVSGGVGTFLGASGNGRRLNRSAFACCSPGW